MKLSIKLGGDKKIWYILFALAVISILSVYSSSYRQTMYADDLTSAIFRHVRLLTVGFAAMYLVHLAPLNAYRLLAPIALLAIILCLILVILISGEFSRRWLFSRSFQPSDFAKVFMVVYLAKVMSEGFDESLGKFLKRVIVPIAIVCGLIISAHTSTTLIIGGTSMILIVMGAGKKKYVGASMLLAFAALSLYLLLVKMPAAQEYLTRGDTAASRLSAFFRSGAGAEDYEQAQKAKYAIINGGLFGQMPGKSFYRKTLTEAHNDFIFVIIIEEYGLLLGGTGIIILYLILFYRVLLVIRKCRMAFTSLLLSGLLVLILMQTFIHIGVSVGGLPVTGQNLPMISTGGSSILVTCIAFGMILSVSRTGEEQERNEANVQHNSIGEQGK
ncbi:MAG: FtsW/RodA/SpoVE family cell cycle protein [Prevotellaceae bacterium]|jgi:cell division protein FtsW|nr:FtsW/RodA/SpoVE family cell cycle protein [Prevotellaceae bacterium]